MTYPSEVLADNPQFYWQCHELVGTTLGDSSPNAVLGTLHDGVTLGQTGMRVDGDKAILLDGSTGYVSTTYIGWVAGAQRTYEACYKRTSSATDQVLFASQNGLTMLRFNAGTNDANFWPNTSFGPSGWTVPAAGTFAHCVLRLDDAAHTAELFINGATLGLDSGIPSIVSGGQRVVIGSRGDAFAYQSFGGVVDEVAEYIGLLSNGRISAHYAALTASAAIGRGQFNSGSGYVKKPSKVNVGGIWTEKPFKVNKAGIWTPLA